MFGLRLPAIDAFSFWLGFAVAAALAYGLYRFRHTFVEARQGLAHRLRGVREVLTSGFERQLRDDVLRYAQTAHLAGALFALDEILLPPRVWPLPPVFDPTAPPPDLDLNSAIPVLPDWPELAALYGAPSLSVAEALAGGGHLLVLGPPGAGKTTLLAHLATARLALGDLVGATEAAAEAVVSARQRETRVFECLALLTRAQVARAARAAADDVTADLDSALVLVRETGARGYEPFIREELARLHNDGEELQAALRLFEKSGARGHARRLASGISTG